MKEKDTIDWILIRKKIDATLSPAERKTLDKWLKANPRRQKFVTQAEKYYQQDIFPVLDKSHIDYAWKRFDSSRRKKTIHRYLYSWIAAASVVVMFGCWLLLNQGTTVEERNQELSKIAADTISPGMNKAYLILSDGSTVELGQKQAGYQLSEHQVDIRMDSTGVVYDMKQGTTKEVYNTIRIPQGGEYQLTLSDGTHIWLNSQSELTYPVAFHGAERQVKLTGEAYFKVTKNEKRPFIVETQGMKIKVLGTEFNVQAYHNEPSVITTLITGKVEVLSETDERNILYPSQQAVLSRETGITDIREVNTFVYTQWREGRFVFRDNTLDEIMRALARWYDMDYEFSVPELEHLRFYGVINRYANVKELLEQFEKTGKIRFEYSGKKVTIKK